MTSARMRQEIQELGRQVMAKKRADKRDPILPHIDDVCLVFHRFQLDSMQAMTRHQTNSMEQTKAFNEARDKLRVALKELSLYQHIDWTEK